MTSLTLEKFDAIMKDAFEKYKDLEAKEFKHHKTTDGIEVSTLKFSGESYIVRGEGYTKLTPDELYSQLTPNNTPKQIKHFNPKLSSREVYKEFQKKFLIFFFLVLEMKKFFSEKFTPLE
jgi:hypothetical protein